MELTYNAPNAGNPTALSKFYLSQEELLEMRANYYCNSVSLHGDIQFRVYEFVTLLNEIIGKNNVFRRLNTQDQVEHQAGVKKGKKDQRNAKN